MGLDGLGAEMGANGKRSVCRETETGVMSAGTACSTAGTEEGVTAAGAVSSRTVQGSVGVSSGSIGASAPIGSGEQRLSSGECLSSRAVTGAGSSSGSAIDAPSMGDGATTCSQADGAAACRGGLMMLLRSRRGRPRRRPFDQMPQRDRPKRADRLSTCQPAIQSVTNSAVSAKLHPRRPGLRSGWSGGVGMSSRTIRSSKADWARLRYTHRAAIPWPRATIPGRTRRITSVPRNAGLRPCARD